MIGGLLRFDGGEVMLIFLWEIARCFYLSIRWNYGDVCLKMLGGGDCIG